MPNLNTFQVIRDKLTVDDDGVGHCSTMAVPALIGVSKKKFLKFRKDNKESSTQHHFNVIREFGFYVPDLNKDTLDDMTLDALIKYIAFNKLGFDSRGAQKVLCSYSDVGIRAVIREVCGE